MLTDQQTITVDTVARDYAVTDYPTKGSMREVAITDGESKLSISHEKQSSGIERHLVKLQDDILVNGEDESDRVHIVLSGTDAAATRVRLAKLCAGLLVYLQTAGLVDRILLGES